MSIDRVNKWHTTMKKKASCLQNSPFLHVIKSRISEEDTKECLGPSCMCLWERSGEKRLAAPGNSNEREKLSELANDGWLNAN